MNEIKNENLADYEDDNMITYDDVPKAIEDGIKELKNPPKKRGRKPIHISSEVIERVKELRGFGLSYEKIVNNIKKMGHEITVYRVKKIVAM